VLRPPWWAFLASGASPVLLIGGWTLAASRQPAGYDPIRDTISALAARGATDRWIMSIALVGVGCCYLLSAAALRSARRSGRALLGVGGLGTIAVAAFPQPIRGNSIAHTVAASVAFTALALWPVVVMSRASGVLFRPTPALLASLVMITCIVWFLAEIHGGHRGVAERAAAGSEAVWPFAVVASSWTARRMESSAKKVPASSS
jgi:hypothetical membrane protein